MKLSKRALKGLKGAIKKWEDIAFNDGFDDGEANCPLCKLYSDAGCMSCPVYLFGRTNCGGTPYSAWNAHRRSLHFIVDVACNARKVGNCATCKELAIKELNYLKSLLPE